MGEILGIVLPVFLVIGRGDPEIEGDPELRDTERVVAQFLEARRKGDAEAMKRLALLEPKELAQPILIGERAASQLGEEGVQSQGDYLLAGLRTPRALFAPIGGEQADGAALAEVSNLKLLQGGRP